MVVTIRAFNVTDIFFKNYRMLNSNAAMAWLILRVETLQNLILLSAALLIVLQPGKRLPGFVGQSLSYAITLNTIQVIMTRFRCNLSNYIVSVERIEQFMHIPPEPPAIVEDMRPPFSWPTDGRIELQDLKKQYRPNAPLVLKGITCTFVEETRVDMLAAKGQEAAIYDGPD
ncbi:unnamed protein product [Dovyalis caffra]|uniref:ABC transmembrane type-1 domain-containing protein n=1 Tax=Dovyalis caffra TaxID=77055 RepID=A0AAV1SUD7_9ROSI|nr:unnamed protein product [Dovyalis caffra]